MDSGCKEFAFFWLIENYSFCWDENGEGLASPEFIADGLEGAAFHLVLYPRSCTVTGVVKGFTKLFLFRHKADDGPESVPIKFELSVPTADGSALYSKEYDFSRERKMVRGSGDGLTIAEGLSRRNFPQDILTVRCKLWRGEGDVQRVSRIWARTRIGIEKISFLHEVENFSTLRPNQKHTIEMGSHLKKESFASSSLYFTHDSCREGEMVVEITPFHSSHFLCKRKISLLGSGNGILCAEDDNRFDFVRKIIRKLPLSLTRQVILTNKSEYLPDDKLSLLCECSFSTGQQFTQIEETQCEMPIATAKLKKNQELSKNDDNTVRKASAYPSISEDIKALYVNQTNFQLKTKTKSFPVHKIVLYARSPVFQRMLKSDMREKNTDFIQVDDLRDDVVQQLLLFLYSDTVENLQWEMATRLYYAADKYQVDILKEVCSSFLVANLTPTNAGELVLLADTHSDGSFKKSVEDFILEHDEQVFGSDEWETLMKKHPLIAMETMHLKYKRRKL